MNPLSRPEGDSSPERGSFGGRKEVKRMADEKSPCTAGEWQCRDYNELGIYRHKDGNRTLEAAQLLWAFLPAWMAARDMAAVDRAYNKQLSSVIAENAEIILKAAKEMAGWETEQGGEEDGGGLHCSGLDRDGDRHGADGTDGKRTAALVCVVRAGGECGCNSRNAADRGISEMS